MQIVRVMRGRRRALISVIGAATLVAASSAILLAPADAATTTTTAATTTTTTVPSFLPAGKVTIQATTTFHLQTCVPAPCHATAIPFPGTLVGTSDGNGNLTFPKSGITSPAQTLTLSGAPVTVRLVALSNYTGTLNTKTGLVTLTGTSETLLDVAALAATNCPIGPTTVHLSSANPGGVKYNATANTATITDTTFTVPVVTNPPASCNAGAVTVLNQALALPITASSPARSIVDALKIFPPGAVVPTTTTAPTTTTPTTAAPASTVAPSALPRTGGSDWPIAAFGVALVGGGLALASRRRRGLTRP
jgi:LPXTG-motif cell wall-anchored protein